MTRHAELRQAFGHFGTGVAIIGLHNRDNQPVGLTINSFASVSLEPALLSWCLANDSQLFDDVANAAHFSVNILAADQIELSGRMAGSGSHVFKAEELDETYTKAPVLRGALAQFDCHVHHKVQAGDHLMLIGGIDAARQCAQGRAPLIYFRGNYAALADGS